VIVPVYNTGKYLAPCLESILAQTLKEIEVICVDDGSTDGSPALLDEYAARDVRVVVIHQANAGPAVARNAGLERASAPYIGFVDSDDLIEPQTYETALAIMAADQEIDFVNWNHDNVAEPGVRLPKSKKRKSVWKRSGRFSGKRAVDEAVFSGTGVSVWHKLHRAALISAHSVAFPAACEGAREDFAFTWKYLAWARYGFFLDACLYHYRYWSGALANAPTKMYTKFDVEGGNFRDVLEYYRRHELLSVRGRELARVMTSSMTEMMMAEGWKISGFQDEYLRWARQILDEFDLPDPGGGWASRAYRVLRRGQVPEPKLTWLEKIISVTNWGPHKVVRFLGLKLKFPRR
jgi:glycosyltransferase involved in cell wall biosynthesis